MVTIGVGDDSDAGVVDDDAMKFRVTIERYVVPVGCGAVECEHGGPGWEKIHSEEIEISLAERAARMIDKIIQDQGLEIDGGELRNILVEELGER